jgi:hypothetical protein
VRIAGVHVDAGEEEEGGRGDGETRRRGDGETGRNWEDWYTFPFDVAGGIFRPHQEGNAGIRLGRVVLEVFAGYFRLITGDVRLAVTLEREQEYEQPDSLEMHRIYLMLNVEC